MAKFRNLTTDTLSVNAPVGHPDAHEVEPGGLLSVPGEFAETDDAYVVGEGDKARAYSRALWEVVEDAPKVIPTKAVGVADAAPKEK